MDVDLAVLPHDVDALHRLIRELAAKQAGEHKALTQAQAEIERLRLIVLKLQRQQFGRRAERLAEGQLELGLEDLGADIGRVEELLPTASVAEAPVTRDRLDRPSLPEHLEREEVSLDLEVTACSCCGGALHLAGETVSEMLDWVPARLRVVRIRRPKYGCRGCGTIHQVPAPERPIALGRKNHLFAGSDGGADRWAIVCSLITTAKLNDREPYAYLKNVLERMTNGHPANRLDDLLPWNWTPVP